MILSLNNDQTSQRDANFSVRATLLYDVVVIKYTLAEFAEVITSITLINEAFNGQPILGRFATFCQCFWLKNSMILSLNNDQTSQRDANFSVRATLLYDVVVIKYTLAEFAEVITSITLINEAFNGQPILGRFATFCQCLSVRTAKLWQFMRFSRFGRLRHLG